MKLSSSTIRLMADALEVSSEEIDDSLTPGTSEVWSSLSHMRLILSLEERLGRRLAPREIISVVSASAVEALLSKRPALARDAGSPR